MLRHPLATWINLPCSRRHVRLFRNGRIKPCVSPATRLDADEAIVRRDGDRLIVEPAPARPRRPACRLGKLPDPSPTWIGACWPWTTSACDLLSGLRYLLDTNTLSALIRQPQGPVAAMLTRRGYGTVCTSIVVAAELRFGARKRGSSVLNQGRPPRSLLPVLPLEAGVDQTYAELYSGWNRRTPIGPLLSCSSPPRPEPGTRRRDR